MQGHNTAPYETAHKEQKVTARATNGKRADFLRQHATKASRLQSLKQAGHVRPALGSLLRGEITSSNIVPELAEDGIGTKYRIRLTNTRAHCNTIANDQQQVFPITMENVSVANHTARGSAPGSRVFYMVCFVSTLPSAEDMSDG